jgi:two-component system, LytTR family, response regulator
MRVLIVDDEPIARKVLREELEVIGGFDSIEEAVDGPSALETIHASRPDLVFLDLQMPGLTGFDVVRRIEASPMPVIIIVTAFDQHAIQAFEAGAIDYLLKPVSSDRLATALQRAARLLGKPAAIAEETASLHNALDASPGGPPRKIVGRNGEEYFLLSPEEVLAFQAEGDVVWIFTSRRRYQATMTLKALQEKLRGLPFQRIHRSALVNVSHVRKMASLSSQRWLLTLHNSQEFIVSKRQARLVREMLSG